MTQHVVASVLLWDGIAMTSETTSAIIDVSSFLEGRIFIQGDVTAETWTPKLQQRDPKKGTWFDRGDLTFTVLNTSGGPGGDGLAQQQIVIVGDLGGRIRLVMTPSGSSPSASITATFEGKT